MNLLFRRDVLQLKENEFIFFHYQKVINTINDSYPISVIFTETQIKFILSAYLKDLTQDTIFNYYNSSPIITLPLSWRNDDKLDTLVQKLFINQAENYLFHESNNYYTKETGEDYFSFSDLPIALGSNPPNNNFLISKKELFLDFLFNFFISEKYPLFFDYEKDEQTFPLINTHFLQNKRIKAILAKFRYHYYSEVASKGSSQKIHSNLLRKLKNAEQSWLNILKYDENQFLFNGENLLFKNRNEEIGAINQKFDQQTPREEEENHEDIASDLIIASKIDHYGNLIVKNEFLLALETFLTNHPEVDNSIKNMIILWKSQYNDIQNQLLKDIISRDDANLSKNRLNSNFLEFINNFFKKP